MLGEAGQRVELADSLDRTSIANPFEIEVVSVNNLEETSDTAAAEPKVLTSEQIGQQVLEQSGAIAANYNLNKSLTDTLLRSVLDVNA